MNLNTSFHLFMMNRTKIIRWFMISICFLCVIHFLFSKKIFLIITTVAFAIALFALSVISLVLIYERKSIGKIIISLTILLAMIVFFYETSNHLCQMRIPISHIGNQYYYISVGYEEFYCNWWWHHKSYDWLGQQEIKQ